MSSENRQFAFEELAQLRRKLEVSEKQKEELLLKNKVLEKELQTRDQRFARFCGFTIRVCKLFVSGDQGIARQALLRNINEGGLGAINQETQSFSQIIFAFIQKNSGAVVLVLIFLLLAILVVMQATKIRQEFMPQIIAYLSTFAQRIKLKK